MTGRTFYCEHCNEKFIDLARKETASDPVYGFIWKFVADCPSCDKVAGELKDVMRTKKSSSSEVEPLGCATSMCPYSPSN